MFAIKEIFMQTFIKPILFILILVLFSACSSKRITVKSLYPSKITNEKIHLIYVEDFINDDLYQSLKIQNKLTNKTINGKKVFKVLNENRNNIVVQGIVDSSLSYDTYYKKEIDYKRCRAFKYIKNEGKKKAKRVCRKYHIKSIPCEIKKYKLQTNIKVLKNNRSEILFAKTYTKTKTINECFRYNNYYTYKRNYHDIRKQNMQLADLIANDFIQDISPHYVYFNIEIIDELDENNLNYTDNHRIKFKNIVDLIEKNNINLSFEELQKLDKELNHKSYEVIYNIALIYEANSNLFQANKLYKEANSLINNIDNNKKLINNAIIRTDKNLEEKIKAKSQLP